MSLNAVVKIVESATRQMKNRIMLIVGRGRIESVDDSKKIQLVKGSLLAGEVKDGMESMAHFGFSSNCPEGGDMIINSVASNRDHAIIIATEHREYRFKDLGSGEVVLYSKDGDHVHLKDGNAIDIKTKTLNITAETIVNITSPNVNISGNLEVGGDEKVIGNVDVTGNETVGGSSTVTGDSTAANVIGLTGVAAPSIVAASGMSVGGVSLAGYGAHTHSYDDDNGTGTTSKETGVPTP